MDWTARIDGYCERTDPGLWSEPLNAISNFAFLAAAVWAWSRRRGDTGETVLIAVLAAIGVGSALFHTVATRWAALADVIPIGIFIVVYLALALRRMLRFGVTASVLGLFLFLGIQAVAPRLFGVVAGSSASYLPALAALMVIAGLAQAPEIRRGLLVAAGLFAISLVARMADQPLCTFWPSGTHFLWHILNAVVLARLVALLPLVRVQDARSSR